MSKSTTPHDAIAKTFLSDLAIAEDFLRSHLPAAVKKAIDFNTLKLEPTSLVDENLKHYTTDILYSVNIDDTLGFIYCLVEAQSTPDKMMPFRFWNYQALILNRYLKNHPDEETKLPVIIPLLLYTGKQSPYPYSLELIECFENQALAKSTLYQPPKLIDLSQIPDDEIKQHGRVAVLEMVQKHIHDRDLMSFAYDFISLLNQIKIAQNLYNPLLEYIITTGESKNFKGFLEMVIKESINNEYRGDAMTIAQCLQNEAASEAKFEIARNLLKMGMTDEMVAQATELPRAKIQELHSA